MAEKKGLDPIQKELLAQVADLHKMPEGAYSLRINGNLEGWPWEAQSSPRVARESWGWRSSHCRAEETSPKRVSGT